MPAAGIWGENGTKTVIIIVNNASFRNKSVSALAGTFPMFIIAASLINYPIK